MTVKGGSSLDIAVVGMSLRVPGASTPERFWRNIVEGRDTLRRRSEKDLRAMGVPEPLIQDSRFVAAAPLVEDVEYFDAAFFGIAPFEAEVIDPAQRLFLECSWESLEAAGVRTGARSPVTGVFAGIEGSYQEAILHSRQFSTSSADSLSAQLGSAPDFAPARVSFKLDLTGPSFAVGAACATSLLAVHLAARSLRAGECELAIAGGSTVLVPDMGGYLSGVEGMLSAGGRIRAFDENADGTIFGSGCGTVVLKPLEAAIADGNHIHAVLRGSATSNDGSPSTKESFIAPSPEGQTVAIARALEEAGVPAETIGLLEAHGTGTLLGDPIEVQSLSEVYRRETDASGYCALGSVKSNVGHLRMAAGVVSFIKACLALEHRVLPPMANFETPNPRIGLEDTPFFVTGASREWPEAEHPRRAGVSAFGFGGSNAHAVLEEWRGEVPSDRSARRRHLFALSAHTPVALERRIADLEAWLEANPDAEFADVAHSLNQRKAFPHAACFVVDDAVRGSDQPLGAPDVRGQRPADGEREVVFLFPGQGSQRPGMGQALYETEPVYREVVDRCAELLGPELGFDIRSLIHLTPDGDPEAAREALRQTGNAQPALFVVEYALARLFESFGVRPSQMLGHSVGELVAACLAGVFSLPDALRMVAARSRLMQRCEPGDMLAVMLPVEVAQESAQDEVEVAAVNGPFLTVLSGPPAAIERVEERMQAHAIGTRRLETSHAFHSAMMEPALAGFRELLADIELAAPARPFLSNLTGEPITAEQATDPDYWAAHLRRTVQFSGGVQHLLEGAPPLFVELGPGRTLCELVRVHDPDATTLSALANDGTGAESQDGADALRTLGQLFSLGGSVELDEMYAGERRRKLAVPTYPFQRRRHWPESERREPAGSSMVNLYEAGFRENPIPRAVSAESAEAAAVDAETLEDAAANDAVILDERPWIVFPDRCGLADGIVARLRAGGAEVTTVLPGERFEAGPDRSYRVRPGEREDLDALLEGFDTDAEMRPRVLQLWGMTGPGGPHNDVASFDASAELAYHAVIALVQAANARGLTDGLDLLVVADGLQAMDDETCPIHAEKAALLGPCRVGPQDVPGLRIRAVDLPSVERWAPDDWAVGALLAEAQFVPGSDDRNILTLLRPTGRFTEELYPVKHPPVGAPRLREGGVVLITGGMSGIALSLAGQMFEQSRARIALLSRWEPPPRDEWPTAEDASDRKGRALAAIAELEACGAEVEILLADVSDRDSLASAIDATRKRFGAIHGVLHAAGVLTDESLVTKTREASDLQFEAKARGALHLDALLGDEPLDLFVCFSSIASKIPTPGRTDYSASNAVLDSLMRRRKIRHPESLSCAVAWGPWLDVGMAAQKLETTEQKKEVVEYEVEELAHPLIQTRLTDPNGRRRYRGRLFPDRHWPADEHRFDDRPLLAATSVLECIRAAYADHAGRETGIQLEQVSFLNPLFVDEGGREIEIRFRSGSAGDGFEVRSRGLEEDAPWTLNTIGYASELDETIEKVEVPPAPAEDQPYPYLENTSDYLTTGPRWDNVQEIVVDGDATAAWLRLKREFAADTELYGTHPAIVDMGLACTTGRFSGNGLPYSFDRIRIFARMGPLVRLESRRRQIRDFDRYELCYADAAGNVIMDVDGYVLRDVQGTDIDPDAAGEDPRGGAAAVRLEIERPGDLDSMRWLPTQRPEAGPNDVVVEVAAAGLNFRDLLTALGELPNQHAGQGLGVEFSGVVREVGPEVTHVAPGDPVLGMGPGALGTFVPTYAAQVRRIPPGISFEEAAGIPIAFLTAEYALTDCAHLRPGERILIHCATGGVGVAAVQLAKLAGAEIFATAGSPAKREYLEELGVEHVMDSRSLDFVDEILEKTGGEGVDVVLNSLAGEYIEAGLRVLRPMGRFLEIGKRDFYADTPMGLAPFARNLSYFGIDLSVVQSESGPHFARLFDRLMDRFLRGELEPAPTKVYPVQEVTAGFQRMARAEHMGKIVFDVGIGAVATQGGDAERIALLSLFEKYFGEGIEIDRGIETHRRLLCCDSAPPFVLAIVQELDRVNMAGRRSAANAVGGERARPELAVAFREASNEDEEKLVESWEKVLGIAGIGVDDDFFDLGGDSIGAIQVQAVITGTFEIIIPMSVFLECSTVAKLAAYIRDEGHGSDE